MNIEHIRQRVSDGFKPFLLQLCNGRKFAVPHPEFVVVGEEIVEILRNVDSVTIIDPLHVASIEDMPPRRKK